MGEEWLLEGSLNGLVVKIASQVISSRHPYEVARNHLSKHPMGDLPL